MAHLQELKAALDTGFSSGLSSPTYRESSASYPPLSMMQQPGSPAVLQMQLQALQSQIQQQRSIGSVLQPRTSGLETAPRPMGDTSMLSTLPLTGTAPLYLLIVTNESSLAAIFQQVVSQVQTPCLLYAAATNDMWSMIAQIKTVTGRPQGPDMVFFQPDVLVANPGTAVRVKQVCGGTSAVVVLQAAEPIARVLQADDFLPGPTPAHPLRKDELSALLAKWRRRQASATTSSTASSVGSTAGTTALPAAGVGAAAAAASTPTTSTPRTSSTTPSAAANAVFLAGLQTQLQLQPQQSQLQAQTPTPQLQAQSQTLQLQQLQAQLQALQQAKLQQAVGAGAGGSVNSTPRGPAGGGGGAHQSEPSANGQGLVGPRLSPARPPPLRLGSAGVVPSDTHPDTPGSLARASMPTPSAQVAPGGADVQDLVAQVAELRRKLGEKSRTPSMRSPTISGTGMPSGGGLHGSSSMSNSLGGTSSVGGGGGGAQLSRQLPSLPSADLQQKLQELQQQQQFLTQRLASMGAPGGQRAGSPPARTVPWLSGGDVQASSGSTSAQNHPVLRLEPDMRLDSPRRSGTGLAGSANGMQMAAGSFSGGALGSAVNRQLQQQLLQLQQLQAQLSQQQRGMRSAVAAGPAVHAPMASFAAADMPLTGQPSSLSASGSLASPGGSGPLPPPLSITLPSPTGGGSGLPSPGALLAGNDSARSTPSANGEGSTVSRSNSFVAAGGSRYRPPRQRPLSPLGAAATAGHMSDGYGVAQHSRFASTSPLRSGSGSVGQGGSGYTSDGASGPRDSVRSSGARTLSKSGDDAIAAALSAASGEGGEGQAAADPPESSPPSATSAAGESLAAVLRELDSDAGGTGRGGSSTDGRSLMDASFALEDSGAGGRGSINGGGGDSSIDLQPSPLRAKPAVAAASGKAAAAEAAEVAVPAAAAPAATAAAADAAAAPPAAAREPKLQRQRSNQGAAAMGSHRLSAGTLQSEIEAAEEEESQQGKEATRQQVPAQDRPETRDTAVEATPPAPPAPSSASKLLAFDTCQTSDLLDLTSVPEDDAVLVASPDVGARGERRATAADGAAPGNEGTAVAAAAGAASAASRQLARVESLNGERLPSIDGSTPLAAAVPTQRSTLGGGAGAGAASLLRVESGSAAASVSLAGPLRMLSGGDGGSSSSPTVSSADKSAAETEVAASQVVVLRVSPSGRRTVEGFDMVASIEGSIGGAGLARCLPPQLQFRQQGSEGDRRRGGGAAGDPGNTATSRVHADHGDSPHASAGTAASVSGYTEDIFAILHPGGEREAASPAPLRPPRSSTPPARRLARILMSSHPIVITREDFLPS